MTKYKKLKTKWQTDQWEDKQLIQKTVRLSAKDEITFLVAKPKNEFYPESFSYLFSPDMVDITKPVEFGLMKKGQWIFGWRSELKDMDGIIGLIAANEVQVEREKVNLFDCHVEADLMLIVYATPDGQSDTAKFPLTGFCENYLKLFVKSV